MRRALSVSLLCCLCGVVSACGSDPAASKPEADQGADMVTPADMSAQPDQGGEPDLVVGDDMPADQGVDMAPADMMETPDMAPDMEPDMEPDMPLAVEYPCAFPSSDPQCAQGEWGASSVLSEFYVVPNRSCCFDYTGDGQIDNAVGAQIVSLAQTLGFADVNSSIASAIGTGELVYLITYADWTALEADSNISLSMLSGTDTDLDYLDNLQGTGSFFPDPASLDAQGKPLWRFSQARVAAPAMAGGQSKLSASGGSLDVTFPGLVDAVELRLEQVRLEASVVGGATLEAGGRVALVQGKLGGVLPRARFFDSLNVVSNQCACLRRDAFAYNAETNRYTCTLDQTYCAQDPDDGCRSVGDRALCSSLAFLSRQTDVDTDSDGRDDAFSFGATFEAVGTQLITP